MKKSLKLLTALGLSLNLLQAKLVTAEVTVSDINGEVSLKEAPERIVTLGFPEYDSLRALGLEDLVVAAPVYLTPDYIGSYGDSVVDTANLHEPNLEVIAGLSPDLIIASSRSAALIPEFEQIAPVFQFSTDNNNFWESFVSINTELAKIFGKEKEASTLIEGIDADAEIIRDFNRTRDESTLVLMLNEGQMTVYGAQSRFGLIYQVLGFNSLENFAIEDQRHGQAISFEGILELNPDRIFVIDRTQAIGQNNSSNDGLMSNQLIEETTAYQTEQIHFLNSELWYVTGSGLESTQLQLQEIAGYLELSLNE